MASDYLIQLRTARDVLVASLIAHDDLVEYEIRGRRHRIEGRYELTKALELLRKQIDAIELEELRASTGRTRNLAVVVPR